MEHDFRSRRREIQGKFNAKNFSEKQISDVSLEPFIRSLCKKKNESDFRNEIMAKYMNRKFMSKEELSYLDLTSNLTDQFIDHEFYSKMVKVVSKKAII